MGVSLFLTIKKATRKEKNNQEKKEASYKMIDWVEV